MSEISVAVARAETPGVAHVAHFNNAGAALPPKAVIDAQLNHIRLESEIGGYEAADKRRDAIEQTYSSIATLLNAQPDEIALLDNASTAWQMAFYGLSFAPGDKLITVEAEYAANFVAYLQRAQRDGVEVLIAPSGPSGDVDVEALEAMIDDRVKLITATHIPTNGGLVNPAAAIGQIARKHGVPYLLDACQSVGQMTIDVEAIGCDMLSATARKYLRGPRGVGFLYVRRGFLDQLSPPMIDHHAAPWIAANAFRLRDDARRFETWEFNYAAVLGLGAAVDYALALGLGAIESRVLSIAGELRAALSGVKGVKLRDIGSHQCGIVSFEFDGVEPIQVKTALRSQGVNISVSKPSSTLLDAERRQLPDMVRASVHYYNDSAEIERLISALASLR